MPSVVRIGDPITCGDTMGQGSGNVFANGIPVSRIGVDRTIGHCFPPVPIIRGSQNVFVNNIPVDRVGDPIPPHCCGRSCHAGVAAIGSPNVFANDPGALAPAPPENPPTIAALDEARQPTASRTVFGATLIDQQEEDPPARAYFNAAVQQEGPLSPAPVDPVVEPLPPNTMETVPSDCEDINKQTLPIPGSFQLSPNFQLKDLTTNCRITKYKVVAQVGLTEQQIICNLRKLCINVLEPLKARYGDSMVINSGFRQGSSQAQHGTGQAVDVAFPAIEFNPSASLNRIKEVQQLVPFDQLLHEKARSFWVHVSFADPPFTKPINKVGTIANGGAFQVGLHAIG